MAEKIWKCPKCRRIFRKEKQQHSCKSYPIENHFKGKPYAKDLYSFLKSAIKNNIGPFTVESLPCCIHFVNKKACTFAAVYALRNGIRMHLASGQKPKGPRIKASARISSLRYLFSIDIKDKAGIDAELMGLLKEAYSSG
jgi:uncharacterized C2H2 Zn-finger protein